MRDEANSSGLALSRYNKQELTPEEINLKRYFEVKEQEKRRIDDLQKQQKDKRLQQMQNINKRLDSSNMVQRVSEKKGREKVTSSVVQPENAIKEENKGSEKGGWQVVNSAVSSKRKRHMDDESDDDSDDSFYRSNKGSNSLNKRGPTVSTERSEAHLDTEIFKPEYILMSTNWSPHDEFQEKGTQAGAKELVLENFGFDKFQTLAVKLTVPSDSDHYSINITPCEENNNDDIFYHINPRKAKYNNVTFNDRTVTWGRPVAISLDKLPQLFDTTIELVLQVRKEGFVAFVNGVFINFFHHRRELSSYTKLRLQIPTQDDNGYPCKAIFRKIWWGWQEPEIDEDKPYGASLDDSRRSTSVDSDKHRTIFVAGLPRCDNDEDANELESYLYELFDEYDIETVSLVSKKGIGFVKVRDPQRCRDAIKEKNGCAIAMGGENEGDEVQQFYLLLSQAWADRS